MTEMRLMWMLPIATAFLAAVSTAATVAGDNAPTWMPSFREAKKAVELAQKPLFVVFVRAGNKDCERMTEVLREPKVVKEFLSECVLARLDADQLESRRVMNRFRIAGAGMPFMVLFGVDWRIKCQWGGFLAADEFLKRFKPFLRAARESRSPVQVLLSAHKAARGRAGQRRYGWAIQLYEEAWERARSLNAEAFGRQVEEELAVIDEYGYFELMRAKRAFRERKATPERTIAFIKRLMLDFRGRGPGQKAEAFLDELHGNRETTVLVETVEPLRVGYLEAGDALRPVDAQGPHRPKRPKALTKLRLRDGTELVGTIVARSANRVYFRPRRDDSGQPKARLIKLVDIASQERAE